MLIVHAEDRDVRPAPLRPGQKILIECSGANVPTSPKGFVNQKLLSSIFSTKGALRRHPDPTYPFLALNKLNRPQKLASGHGQLIMK